MTGLPAANQPWPPDAQAPVTAQLTVWSSWYGSDADALATLYGGDLAGDPSRPLGGWYDPNLPTWRRWIGSTAARFFWGVKTPSGEKRTKLHLPVARDIASTSADLLFGEPPGLSVDTTPLQKRLDKITDGLVTGLTEAAELAAGLGGCYLRIVWDTKVRGWPWLNAISADSAIPEWRYDVLTAVTFWRETRCDGNTVYRHLEYHTPGHILHGLYKGGRTYLGAPVGLDQDPETADLQPDVVTGVTGLTAAYIPNMRPAPGWRHVPAAQNLGRADFDDTEPFMDALDETYSSLMRDIRLAKARLHVPSTYLQSNGPGQGAEWVDRELYTPVNVLGRPDDGLQIDAQQFEIRVTEHLSTCMELLQRIVSMSGYSTQTFGLIGDTTPVTATEVTARERRSFTTRKKKIGYWTPELTVLTTTLLEIDALVFGTGLAPPPDGVGVEFPDGVSEDPLSVAQTLLALEQAQSTTIDTRVRLLHSDWDDVRVRQEVDGIRDEQGLTAGNLLDRTPNLPPAPGDPAPPVPGNTDPADPGQQ